MHFISQELEDYIEQHSEREPELLAALNKETYQKILLPRMLSGHFQGRVLSMLSKLALIPDMQLCVCVKACRKTVRCIR